MKRIALDPQTVRFVLMVRNESVEMSSYRFTINRNGQIIEAPEHFIAKGQTQRRIIELESGDKFSLIFDRYPLKYWLEY